MGSKIEWTDETWNPTTGCTWASPGCDNCYAVRMTRRLAAMGQAKYQGLTTAKHFNGVVKTHDDELSKPLRWKKPRMVFVDSMSDLFHRDVPFEFIDKVFAVMAVSGRHTYQVLTKRPDRAAEYVDYLCHMGETYPAWETLYDADYERRKPEFHELEKQDERELRQAIAESPDEADDSDEDSWDSKFDAEFDAHRKRFEALPWPLPNVWLGTSVESRDVLHRIDDLAKCPASVLFLSCEPLLEDLGDIRPHLRQLIKSVGGDPARVWVIVGGESGPKARPMHPDWVRSIRDQCQAAGVRFFFKQWGEFFPLADDEDCKHGDWYDSDKAYLIRMTPSGHVGNDATIPLTDPDWPGDVLGRVGKKAAGRLLDGREWNEMPATAAAVVN